MSNDKKSKIKEYSNDEITVVWQPDLCIHSANCVKGLPEVFDNSARPWINIQGADTERIIAQVRHCPSGALSFYHNDDMPRPVEDDSEEVAIEVRADGPLYVNGRIKIRHTDGTEEVRNGKVALCRCGASGRKPFCDGSHRRISFQG